jgi:hypothetical protein
MPHLGAASEMIGGEPSAVRRESTLPPEELLALVEPVEGVFQAIVGGELKFGVAERRRGSAAMDVRLSAGHGGRGARSLRRWCPSEEAAADPRSSYRPVEATTR